MKVLLLACLIGNIIGTVFKGNLLLEESLYQNIDDEQIIRVVNIFQRVYQESDLSVVGPHAIQIYMYPAKIISIESGYDFVISDDKYNFVVYSLQGVNTSFVAKVSLLYNETELTEDVMRYQTSNSRIEYLNFDTFTTHDVDWRNEKALVIRSSVWSDTDDCAVGVSSPTIMHEEDTILINGQIMKLVPLYMTKLQQLQHNPNLGWSREASSYVLMGGSCESLQTNMTNPWRINYSVDEQKVLENSQLFVVRYQTLFMNQTCDVFTTSTNNIYQKPMRDVLNSLLQNSVVSTSKVTNETSPDNSCNYNMMTQYTNESDAITAYHHLQRIPKLDDAHIINDIQVFAVPDFTITVTNDEIESGVQTHEGTCNLTISVNVT